jgi:succinoglycan biosynthesis transport protein ExoP
MFDTQEMRASGLPADTAPAVPLPPVGQPTHLLDRLNAVFKHRRLAITAFLLVLATMMIQSYSTIPVYETFAQIELRDERSAAVSSLGVPDMAVYQELAAYQTTQHQVIRSREVGRRVVRRLNLAQHPLFSGDAPRARDPLTLLREARAAVTAWVRGAVSSESAPAAPVVLDDTTRENALISAVMSGVQVRPVEDSLLVNIFYRHHDPEFAALAANTIAEEYAAQNLEKRLETTSNTMAWLTTELKEAARKAEELDSKLAEYRELNKAQSLDDRSDVVSTTHSEMSTQLNQADAELLHARGRWFQVREVDTSSEASERVSVIGNDGTVVAARNALSTLITEQTTLTQNGLGSNHPKMQTLKSQIENADRTLIAARARVKEGIRADYELKATKRHQVAAGLDSATAALSDLDKKRASYQALQRQADAARDTHKNLLAEQNKQQIAASSRENNVRLVDRAEVPGVPISPDTRKDLLTAILAGLALAFGLVFGIEYLDDSVKTPEDVTKRLRLPLLGLVPAVRGERVPVLTETVPHDFGEAFRSLRTSLVFTSGTEGARVIAVTSSQPLEGKTTTACNLALALALGGSRVLLIDADMRRPGLHKTIGLQNGIGLSHLLTGQSRVRDVVERTREPNLFVITAGRTPPNPSELLASERMDQFLANLAQGPFDWVVVDTPPVLAVTDAVILAQKIGSVVFVIGSEMTRRVHAERALETLQAGKTRSIGVVLNRVDFDRNKYYYARYYGYQYKSYYGQNQQSG